jgi:fructose-bisphosphate aldolase class II
VPIEEIQVGIRYGVRKVNVDTDLRMALTGAIRKVFSERPGEFDPRKYLAPGIDAMATVCRDRFEQFGSAGYASRIVPIPLADMVRRYASSASHRAVA